ncbi:MAG: hypothetical protein KF724_06395 [Phycisphaeraceae bacterium]|nr:hypothetical protein [Phycisphaeraceae bacterium]
MGETAAERGGDETHAARGADEAITEGAGRGPLMPNSRPLEAASARAADSSERRSRRRALVLLVAVVGALLVLLGFMLARAAPSWWRPPVGDDRSDARARAIEQGLAAEFTRVRPEGETWAIRIFEADANAWLALRLPLWLKHDRELPWPQGIEVVQIHFERPDRVVVAADHGGRIWSVVFRPRIEAGVLALDTVGGGVGRLWIPWAATTGEGTSSLAKFVPELARPVEAILPLPDDRRVRLLDFEVDRGEIRLQFETLWR